MSDGVDEVGVRLTIYERAKFQAELKAAGQSVKEFAAETKRLNADIKASGKEIQNAKSPLSGFGKDASQTFRSLKSDVGGFVSALGSVYAPLQAIASSTLFKYGVGGITAGFTAAAGAATYFGLSMYNAMQQSNVAFTHMLGSKAAGDQFTKQLVDMANNTPFNFQNIAPSAQRLLNTGDDTTKALSDLTAIGDAAAGADPMEGQQGVDRIALAISQMKGSTTLKAQDMNQLTQANVGPYQLLAAGSGKSEAQIRAAMEKGKIGGPQAAEMLIQQMEKKYGGLMSEQNKTLGGQWSNIKGQAEVGLAKAVTPLAELITRNGPAIQKIVGKLTEDFGKLVGLSVRWGQQLGIAFVHGGMDGFVREFGELTGHSKDVETIWSHVKRDGQDIYKIFVHEYLPVVRDVSAILLGTFIAMEPILHWMADHPQLVTVMFEAILGGALLLKTGLFFKAFVTGLGDIILKFAEATIAAETFGAASSGGTTGVTPVGKPKKGGKLAKLGKFGAKVALPATIGWEAGGWIADNANPFGSTIKQDGGNYTETTDGIVKPPGMAMGGTVSRSGMSWVGENGPELLNLPTGAQVQPLKPNEGMSAGTTVIFEAGSVVIPAADFLKGKELADTVVNEIQSRIARS